jgi:hypothetical protein
VHWCTLIYFASFGRDHIVAPSAPKWAGTNVATRHYEMIFRLSGTLECDTDCMSLAFKHAHKQLGQNKHITCDYIESDEIPDLGYGTKAAGQTCALYINVRGPTREPCMQLAWQAKLVQS